MPTSKVWPGQPYPLGATWDGKGVNFALFSQHATAVVAEPETYRIEHVAQQARHGKHANGSAVRWAAGFGQKPLDLRAQRFAVTFAEIRIVNVKDAEDHVVFDLALAYIVNCVAPGA